MGFRVPWFRGSGAQELGVWSKGLEIGLGG